MTMLKQLSKQDFLAQFDPEIHAQIRRAVEKYPRAEGVVMFENLTLDSSAVGQRQALVVGPDNSFTLEKAEKSWLNDLPSQRQYPQNWCSAKDMLS
jgi:hypothetical protein